MGRRERDEPNGVVGERRNVRERVDRLTLAAPFALDAGVSAG